MQNKDVFGFYRVGNFRTYSKLEAIEEHGRTGLEIDWNFNREVFSTYDWTQEPPQSLEFYYAQRAQQLRDRYDYLVLFYSGGADSYNTLQAFVKNNIFIDEIVQYVNLDAEHGIKTTWLNEEVFATSAPITQNLISTNPVYAHTRHRIIDISQWQSQHFVQAANLWDHWYQINNYFTPNVTCHSYFRDLVTDYKNIFDKGQRLCFIWSVDKPNVFGDKQGNFYLSFADGKDFAMSPRTQRLSRQWENDEFFYWSPDSMDMVAKQAHIIKRFLESQCHDVVANEFIEVTKNLETRTMKQLNQRRIFRSWIKANNKVIGLTDHGLHALIYPYWDPLAIVCGKTKSFLFSPRDNWFFNSSAPDMGQKMYQRGLLWLRNNVKRNCPELWYELRPEKPGDPWVAGIKAMTNQYFLGRATNKLTAGG